MDITFADALIHFEFGDALAEDSTRGIPSNQHRLTMYWTAVFVSFQWQFAQARRGLLPTFNEAGIASAVRGLFTAYRSCEGWWEATKPTYFPEFVEWVEEQRPKAA